MPLVTFIKMVYDDLSMKMFRDVYYIGVFCVCDKQWYKPKDKYAEQLIVNIYQ